MPLAAAGFQVLGVDREWGVLKRLRRRSSTAGVAARLVQADLKSLPVAGGRVDFALSVNVINHGYARDVAAYCRELDRVLKPGGSCSFMFLPGEFADLVRLPETVELEPGTLVKSPPPTAIWCTISPPRSPWPGSSPATPSLASRPIWTPIPFMGGKKLPQLAFLAKKSRQEKGAEVPDPAPLSILLHQKAL